MVYRVCQMFYTSAKPHIKLLYCMQVRPQRFYYLSIIDQPNRMFLMICDAFSIQHQQCAPSSAFTKSHSETQNVKLSVEALIDHRARQM